MNRNLKMVHAKFGNCIELMFQLFKVETKKLINIPLWQLSLNSRYTPELDTPSSETEWII
ncbi:hypothetical protein BLOT_005243 [Blomia tropicalis]|nr:hypothetical protein BLOT_005243 [Blomia tropicalis]